MENVYVDEEELVKHITPKIEERVRFEVIQSIINALEEQCYPPEEMIREEFIKEVKEAEKRVKLGESKTYSYEEFKRRFLANVE